MTRYQKLASKLNINIVPGTIVQKVSGDETSKPVLHNIAPFISSTGELLGSYVKQNLWHPERPHLSPAFKKAEQQHPRAVESPPSPHSVIETPLGPVGLLVCWDIGFPEAFRSLVRQGARIIICPTFWLNTDMSAEGLKINPDAEGVFVRSIIPARACENTCCIIFVNGGGPKEEGFLGLSQVALPIVGTLEGSFTDCEQGMRTLEVDMKIVDVAEANYKIREDMGREDWHYGYSHERP